MTQTYNFQALLAEAQKEGIGGSLLPNGTYNLLAKIAKVSSSQGGKDQIGVMWQVLDGPLAGQTSWQNQTISPENAKAMAAFFGWCSQFGMDSTFFQRQPQPTVAEIAAVIQDTVAVVEVGLGKPWGQNNEKQDNTFKVKQIVQGGLVASAPAAVAPAPVAAVPAVVPAAAPQPVPVDSAPAFQQTNAPAPVAAVPQPAPAAVPQPVAAIDPATGLPARSF